MSGTKYDHKLDELNYSQWQRIKRRLQAYEIIYDVVPQWYEDFDDYIAMAACKNALIYNGWSFYNFFFYECVCIIAETQISQGLFWWEDFQTTHCTGVTTDPYNDGYQISDCMIVLETERCDWWYGDCQEYDQCFCLGK